VRALWQCDTKHCALTRRGCGEMMRFRPIHSLIGGESGCALDRRDWLDVKQYFHLRQGPRSVHSNLAHNSLVLSFGFGSKGLSLRKLGRLEAES
jgi:hypothetical protein